ncbi:MAG TPA: NAD-dependent epimerase/dehydratase family protein [Streptosporangiaceae bacterium]|nr:NAD-dependent epimerase/dehydratase family protein [Streptosporangiaceae bacterium]
MSDGSPSQVLVTGGAGFIGRRVVRALLDADHKVTVIDRQEFPDSGVRSVVGDLCDPATIGQALSQPTDLVIHLAAITRVLLSMEDPVGTYKLNVDATFNLLEQSRQAGVQTFLLASTNAVTGDVGTATITERKPLRPLTPYGSTKAAGEMLLSSYVGSYGMTGAALRFSNVYGPGMEAKDSFIPRLMRAARDGKGVQIYGDGTQLRDLVHVDDIVAGIFTAWRAGHNGPLILGSGESVTVNDILEAARAVTGAEIPAEHIPAKAGEMPAVIIDISAAKALGYQPRYDLKAGIATVWPEFSETAK